MILEKWQLFNKCENDLLTIKKSISIFQGTHSAPNKLQNGKDSLSSHRCDSSGFKLRQLGGWENRAGLGLVHTGFGCTVSQAVIQTSDCQTRSQIHPMAFNNLALLLYELFIISEV